MDIFDGRKQFISHIQRTGENNLNHFFPFSFSFIVSTILDTMKVYIRTICLVNELMSARGWFFQANGHHKPCTYVGSMALVSSIIGLLILHIWLVLDN